MSRSRREYSLRRRRRAATLRSGSEPMRSVTSRSKERTSPGLDVIVMEAFSNAHLRIRVKPVDEADFPQRSNSAIVCRHSGGRMLKRAVVLLVVGAVSVLGQRSNQPFHPQIPNVWEDDAMRDVELPLAAHIPVHHMPAAYYYRI